ncbi:MAG: CoA ester lyase [Desulfomonile tiedjei]|nr:CoA ester lyase [Desulfomonile tiedjei]
MKGPLRSFLFVPATNPRRVEKAFSSNADAVILDLEDAVAVSEKMKARSLVVDVLSRMRRDGTYVRVNGVNTPWIVGDLMAVVGGRPAGIMLPKAECPEEVKRVDWLIGQLESEYGLPPRNIELLALVETARGVAKACEVASASSRTRRLAFGAVDFTLDMGLRPSGKGTELFFARSQLAIASRAAGIEGPIDTVYVNLKDDAGLMEDCRVARELGFLGKLAIHPAQIATINEVFSPAQSEVDYALKVVHAFDEAESQGIAAVQLDGKFIDYPVAEWARRTLDVANCLGLLAEPAQCKPQTGK